MTSVLVVDDDINVREAMRALLALDKIEAVVVENTEQGLKALESDTFDLLFVDIFMPGTDGFKAIKAFREAEPELPIVAMSGFVWPYQAGTGLDFVGMATKLGAAYCLKKPFRRKQLVAAVEACLGRRLELGFSPELTNLKIPIAASF